MTDQVIDTMTGLPEDPFRVEAPAPPVAPGPDRRPSGVGEADLLYLWARLGVVEWRVRQALAAAAADDPHPPDPNPRLYN
ncbi:hypothetical protein AB0G02_39960, partial [Actinosynnema sp. NPDC023658]|uniref:hypothetical protein n=1 Tax=Actinosynnema sp. NPDC023658 TaxID=3155465 RepID=UPI0033D2DD5A